MSEKLTTEAIADAIALLLAEHTDVTNITEAEQDMRSYDVNGYFIDVTTKVGKVYTVLVTETEDGR